MANNAKRDQTIIAKGAIAFRLGQDLDTCPYRTSGKQGLRYARLWKQGWLEAQSNQVSTLLTVSELARVK